jgi:hypothetical protein
MSCFRRMLFTVVITLAHSGWNAGSNRRLEFELGAWFEGACGFALASALSQTREHGPGPFGRARAKQVSVPNGP